MSSETPLQLPIIDFCKSADDLKPGTSEWDSLKSQVWKAISEYGCFSALFDKIPVDNQKTFLCELKELFDLPQPTENGDVSETIFHDCHRYVPICDPLTLENCENFSNVYWPQGNPSLSKSIHCFSKNASELEKIIRRMILESLSVDKYVDEHMSSTVYDLKLIKYEGVQGQCTKGMEGMMPHTDKNLITILYQNQVNGLQVQTKDGEQISVDLSPNNSFFVTTGDSFTAWANGRLHSPYHRVSITENEDRYSVGLFSSFKAGYMVKAPQELVDEEHPLLFKPFDFSEFLKFLKTFSCCQPSIAALKTYCAV